MADNSYKINKSVNLNPQVSVPANPVDGDFYYDSTFQSFAYYHNGSWANMDSVAALAFNEPLTSAQFTPAIVRNSVVKVTGASSPIHLKGISSSFAGKRLTVYNGGTDLITVESDDSGEPTSNNRILTPTGGDMNLIAGEVAVFTYDVIANRWLLVSISSQGGAQVIATTGHPGLVQLHQASLFPSDGIVLSDGDLNTATGVVGLDANLAVTLAAPTSAVPTLTISQHSGSVAIVQKPGSDVDQFTLSDTYMQLGQRQLRFSDNDGFGNHLANFMQYSYLGGTSHRGVLFTNETVNGVATFAINSQSNGSGASRVDLVFVDSSSNQDQITFDQGLLHLGFGSGSVKANFAAGGSFTWNGNSTDLWQVTGAGVLKALGTNRAIQNVLDPVSAQDAATKNYVDQDVAGNALINGHMRYWQRGFGPWTTVANSLTAVQDRKFGADRWAAIEELNSSGASLTDNFIISQQTSGLSSSDNCMRVQFSVNASLGVGFLWIAQEVDREQVVRLRGNKVTLSAQWRKGSAMADNGQLRIITSTDGASIRGAEAYAFSPAGFNFHETAPSSSDPGSENIDNAYTSGITTILDTSVSNAGIGTSFGQVSSTSSVVVPSNATTMVVLIGRVLNNSTAGTNNYLDVTEAQLSKGVGTPSSFTTFTRSDAQELAVCQRYYEKSYEESVQPGSAADYGSELSWVQNVAVVSSNPFPMGAHVRYKVAKLGRPKVYVFDAAGTVNAWTITGSSKSATAGTITGSNPPSETGFHLISGSSFTPTAGLTEGHWLARIEI